MASSSIANFLSLFLSSKAPPPSPKTAPAHLSLSSDSNSSKNRDTFALAPLVASNNYPSSSSNDLMSVVCPSLAYVNTLFFRSAYNVQVIVDDNEPEEKLLNRFRREVMRAGIIQECKRRRFFENKQEEKKRRTRDAAKRNRRRRTFNRGPPPDKVEATSQKKEEDDDNWDLPEGGLPN